MTEGLAYLQGPLEEGALCTEIHFSFLRGVSVSEARPPTGIVKMQALPPYTADSPNMEPYLPHTRADCNHSFIWEKPNRCNRGLYLGGNKICSLPLNFLLAA